MSESVSVIECAFALPARAVRGIVGSMRRGQVAHSLVAVPLLNWPLDLYDDAMDAETAEEEFSWLLSAKRSRTETSH
jgi:hypothetical protein